MNSHLLRRAEERVFADTPRCSAPQNGDALFLSQLTPELTQLGISLLQFVRADSPGPLVFHPRSSKYVESPDNYWTVRIQPRDRSLRITVRGIPSRFSNVSTIELKPDMGTYSAFKIWRDEQLKEAVQVIREASRR